MLSIKDLAKTNTQPKEKNSEDVENMRHRNMMDAIAPYAKKTEQKNVTPLYIDYQTRQTKLILVLCPEWAPQFPQIGRAHV